MGNPKEPFRVLRARQKRKADPAVESLVKQSGSLNGGKFLPADSENHSNEPSVKAREALDELFYRACGIEHPFRSRYELAPTAKPIEGGDPGAIQEYARIVCQHVENLNSLIPSHRKHLLQVSKKRLTWPILISKYPYFSQGEKAIITLLEVGVESGQHLAAYCRYKTGGKIARLVEELIWWVDYCKKMRKLKRGEYDFTQGPYSCDENHCAYPIVSRLHRQLQPREKSAARLKPLSQASIHTWETFVADLIAECFQNASCAKFLLRIFVTAESREQKKGGHGLAKQYLIRKVCDRLKTLAGVKAEAK